MSGPRATKIETKSKKIHIFDQTFVVTSSPIYNRQKRFGLGMTQIGWEITIKVGELSDSFTELVDDRLSAESDGFFHFVTKWYSK